MKYLLDTNICVYWLKGNQAIEKRAMQVGLDKIQLPFITLSELYYGAYKSQQIKRNLTAVKKIESMLKRMDSSEEICKIFGEQKATLAKEGKLIDDADLFIASCALVSKRVLVTNNEKHFSRIKGLKIENWVNP